MYKKLKKINISYHKIGMTFAGLDCNSMKKNDLRK